MYWGTLGVTALPPHGRAGDTLFLFGGHTLLVDPSDKSETDVVHDDVWALDLDSYQVLARGGLQGIGTTQCFRAIALD